MSNEYRREYLGTWHDDKTLRIDLDRVKTRADVDKLRGYNPDRIVFKGVSRNPLDPVIRYMAEILDSMVACGAKVVDDNGPEGIHVTIHDVPEGVAIEGLIGGLRALRPASVLVDASCGGKVVLDYLRQFGVNAEALPKGSL